MMTPRVSFVLLAALLSLVAPAQAAPARYKYVSPRHEGHDDTLSSASASATSVAPAPTGGSSNAIVKQNALDAQKANAQFLTIKEGDSCQGEFVVLLWRGSVAHDIACLGNASACIGTAFAQCVNSVWVSTACSANTACVVLPMESGPGTAITCAFESDAKARFAAAGVQGGITGGDADGEDAGATEDGDDCEDHNDEEGSSDDGDLDCENGEDGDVSASTVTPTVVPVSTAAPSSSAFSTVTSSASTVTSSSAVPTLNNNQQQAGASTILLTAAISTPVPSVASNLYRRQSNPVLTLVSSTLAPTGVLSGSASVSTVLPSTSGFIASSAPFPVPTAATGTAITSPASDPTGIVIGPDGIKTVTIVSTVFVAVSGCTAVLDPNAPVPTASPAVSIPFPVSSVVAPAISSVPASLPSSIFSVPTVTPTVSVPVVTPVSSAVVPVITSQPPAGGISFSSAPIPTFAPAGNGAAAPGSVLVNLSDLLTATVGSA